MNSHEDCSIGLLVSVDRNFEHHMQTHAWLEIREGRDRSTYSIYTPRSDPYMDANPEMLLAPNGHVLRDVDKDKDFTAKLTRDVSKEDIARVKDMLHHPRQFDRHTSNCTHLSLDAWQVATGERIDARTAVGTALHDAAPVGLEMHIRQRELANNEHRELSARGHLADPALFKREANARDELLEPSPSKQFNGIARSGPENTTTANTETSATAADQRTEPALDLARDDVAQPQRAAGPDRFDPDEHLRQAIHNAQPSSSAESTPTSAHNCDDEDVNGR